MFSKKIEKMIREGFDCKISLLLEWHNSDKELISFEELKWIWEVMPSRSSERAQAWKLLNKKAEKLEELFWLWSRMPFGSQDESKILKLITEKIKTLKPFKWFCKSRKEKSS